MAEYIDLEAVIEKNHGGVVYIDDIKNIPAADVAPLRHGRWIEHDDGVFTCSQCGNAESNESYFCRYCGAKMDGDG